MLCFPVALRMLLAVALLICCSPVQAQETSEIKKPASSKEAQQEESQEEKTVQQQKKPQAAEQSHTLKDVVVTASRTEMLRQEVPAVMNIVDSFAIQTTVDSNLTRVLKKNSSVDVIDYPGVLSGVSIRGFRPEYDGINKHYLVLIDGRPAGTTNIATILKDNVERVEVLKGPASSLYGAEAMGGVINVITKKSVGKIKSEIELGGGSFDTHFESASSGGSITPWLDYDLSLMNRNQNGNFRMGNGKKRNHTDFEERHGSLRVGSNFLEKWRLDAKGEWYLGEEIGSPNALFYGDTRPSYKDVERYGGDVSVKGEWGPNITKGTVFASHEESEYTYMYLGQPKYKGYLGTYDWIGTQLQNTYTFLQHDVTVGFDYQNIDVETRRWKTNGTRTAPYYPDNSRENYAVFADSILRFWNDRLILTAGGRYDSFEISTYKTPYMPKAVIGSSDFDHFSPRAGLKWFITPDRMFQFHATAGTAFVPPEARRMFMYAETVVRGVTMVTVGDPDLKPETSFTWDAGITFDRKTWGLRTDLTFFDTRVEDKVARVALSPTLTAYKNVDSAKIQGLELETGWDVGDVLHWNRRVELFANATWLIKAEEELSGGTVKRDIYNVSDWKLNAGVNYDDGRFFGRFLARYMGERKDNDWYTPGYPEITYDPFIVCDLSLGFRFLKRHTLSLDIENIFDEYYYEKPEYPLPGRAIYAKYTLKF